MRAFIIAFSGSFAGKILATIVIAVLAALGFGPDRWAEFLLGIEKPWLMPTRVLLVAIATIALVMLGISITRSRPLVSQEMKRKWRLVQWLASSGQATLQRINRLWQLYGPNDYEVPYGQIAIGPPYYPAYAQSQIEFGRRFAEAFPATRGILTLENTPEIISRLNVLLKWPLTASPRDRSAEASPIYWTSGRGNLHISRYCQYKKKMILINEMELQPTFLAAIGGRVYWQSYVYLESAALPPRKIRGEENIRNPNSQEFAIYNGRIFNRNEYDDGGYMQAGQPVRFTHSPDGRSRYMSKFGFLIVASDSSANHPHVDASIAARIQGVIKDKSTIEEFANFLMSLPKREQ